MDGKRLIRVSALTPAIVGVFALCLLAINANHVAFGVTAAETNVGGETLAHAESLLERNARGFLLIPVVLEYGDEGINTTPKELGLRVDTQASVADAWALGRSSSLLRNIAEQVRAALTRPEVSAQTEIDMQTFHQTLDTLLAAIDEPAENAALVWNTRSRSFDRTPEVSGRVVEREPIHFELSQAAHTLTPPRHIALVRIDDIPAINETDLDEGEALLEEILAALPVTVDADGTRLRLTEAIVAPWLTLTRADNKVAVAMNEQAVMAWLETVVAGSVDRDAQDAVFEQEGGRVRTFAVAEDGRRLDREGALSAVTTHLLSPQSMAADVPLALPVVITEPAIGNDAAEELGIQELLAIGETNFAGSPANRIHNIAIGASRYDGLLVGPGEEFSFNKFLGPVDAASGYKPELVIKPEGTVPEYGGGLCQVSTTAFQGAVQAGFEVTQRRNHSYMVRYYGAPGFDATIYPPYTDLKFVNNSPGHILIQTEVIGTIARFYYYGTNDGRSVAVDGPHTLSLNNDGSGSATLAVNTTYADGTVKEQVFTSYYRSPALYPRAQQNPLE